MPELKQKPLFNPNGSVDLNERRMIAGDTTNLNDFNNLKYAWTHDWYRQAMNNFWIPEEVNLSPDVKDWLIQQGYDPAYGARPLRRVLQRYLEDPLAEEILKGRFTEDGRIDVLLEQGLPIFVERRRLVSTKKVEEILDVI